MPATPVCHNSGQSIRSPHLGLPDAAECTSDTLPRTEPLCLPLLGLYRPHLSVQVVLGSATSTLPARGKNKTPSSRHAALTSDLTALALGLHLIPSSGAPHAGREMMPQAAAAAQQASCRSGPAWPAHHQLEGFHAMSPSPGRYAACHARFQFAPRYLSALRMQVLLHPGPCDNQSAGLIGPTFQTSSAHALAAAASLEPLGLQASELLLLGAASDHWASTHPPDTGFGTTTLTPPIVLPARDWRSSPDGTAPASSHSPKLNPREADESRPSQAPGHHVMAPGPPRPHQKRGPGVASPTLPETDASLMTGSKCLASARTQ